MLLLLLFFGDKLVQAQEVIKEVVVEMERSNIVPVNLNSVIEVAIPIGSGRWYDASTNQLVRNVIIPDASQDESSYYFLVESKAALCELLLGDSYEVIIRLKDPAPPDSIIPESTLFIPDGFSPNGDGYNERFVISGIDQYPNAKLEVYSRWNALVYSKENYGNESRWGVDAWWDGRSNGRMGVGLGLLPSDNYIYILRYDGKVKKGVVFVNW